MKREIAEFVSNYRKLQPISIPEWKWEDITMNFVIVFPRGKKGNDAI